MQHPRDERDCQHTPWHTKPARTYRASDAAAHRRRQRPDSDRERSADNEQGRGYQHQHFMLDHVRREKGGRERVERRVEGGDERQPFAETQARISATSA